MGSQPCQRMLVADSLRLRLFDGQEELYNIELGIDGRRALADYLKAGVAGSSARQFGRYCGLSDRETEIVECLIDGMSNEAIGVYLGISERTVRTHVSNVLTKSGLPSRLAVAVAVGRRPWADVPVHTYVGEGEPVRYVRCSEMPAGAVTAFRVREVVEIPGVPVGDAISAESWGRFIAQIEAA